MEDEEYDTRYSLHFTFQGANQLELHGPEREYGHSMALLAFSMALGILYANSYGGSILAQAIDIGQEIRQNGVGETPCLTYDYRDKTFFLTCNFDWTKHYNENDYILLEANEIFDGNDFDISLADLANSWDGLFKITNFTTIVEGENAPIIRNLHILGGETSQDGGFIVQGFQNNFIVDSCSSSGIIEGWHGGGICGHECSGAILLINCWSTGAIKGNWAGGIAGRRFGYENGQVHVAHCWSEGGILGLGGGGICGIRAGENGGSVTITKSYSTGDIQQRWSGGICGSASAIYNGHVKISECYTLGEISGSESGGITGGGAGGNNGLVEIMNCYTRGDITGSDSAGGICGTQTGGVVVISHVYASGYISVLVPGAGGIIGKIQADAKEINITMSVYNTGPIIGLDSTGGNATQQSQNSADLNDINGTVYCSKTTNECWDTDTIWKAMPQDGFPILLLPSPTPTSTRTQTPTRTPSSTKTPTRTSTMTETQTATETHTPTTTRTRTSTNTQTPTGTPTRTQTLTNTQTPTRTPTQTRTPTPTSTQTPTATQTPTSSRTETRSATGTATKNPSSSSTPTNVFYTSSKPNRIQREILPVQRGRRYAV